MKNVIYLIAISLLSTIANASSQPIWQDKANGVEWIYLGTGTYLEAEAACRNAGENWAMPLLPRADDENPDPNTPWNTMRRLNFAVSKSPLMNELEQGQANVEPTTYVRYWLNAPELYALELQRQKILIRVAELKAEKAKLLGNVLEAIEQEMLAQQYRQQLEMFPNRYTYFLQVGISSYSATLKRYDATSAEFPRSNILCLRRMQ